MRIGAAVNLMVLKKTPVQPIAVFPGEARRGEGWKLFESKNPGAEILTQPEWDEALPIGEAVLRDPVAQSLLNGARYEVPLKWSDNGIECETLGIDIVGPGYLADLKVVHNAEPEYLQKHALRMGWHAQLVWYRTGVWEQDVDEVSIVHPHNGSMRREIALHLLCVESSPPHCVTVLTLSPEVIEAGQKCIRAWLERLRVCAESGHYPGYVQSPVVWELPEWMVDFGDDEEASRGGEGT